MSGLLAHVLAGLREEVFTSPLESVGTLFGIANILLLVRRSIWNYPAGILSVTILGYVFFHTQLFSDTLLQCFFVIVQIVGWVVWLRHREADGELVVARLSAREAVKALLGTAVGAVTLGFFMQRYAHAAYPFWDATVASASVVGQLLLTYRRMENWLWWIGSNVISITIYNLKGLHILSGLYAFYLVMSTFGYVSWRKKLRAQSRMMEAG